MDLTPSQLSSLNEMGIPVWALRSEHINVETNEPLSQCDCLVMVESLSNDKKTQRLLQAMLFSIGLNPDQFTIISSEQLAQLQNSATQQKLLLVLGESFAQSLWGKSVVRGQSHQTVDTAISTIVSFSLEELLASPENKALARHDLQLAKQVLTL